MTYGQVAPITCSASDSNLQGRIVPLECCEGNPPQEQQLNKIWKRNRWLGIDTRPLPYGVGTFSSAGEGFAMGPPNPGDGSTYTITTRVIIPPVIPPATPSGSNSLPVQGGEAEN